MGETVIIIFRHCDWIFRKVKWVQVLRLSTSTENLSMQGIQVFFSHCFLH
uniref:Uncharacterized protein n=1 Tax=Anguilla anguilla TaxID=7936 RepID=A0A0E9WUV2_ANGAN